MSPLTLFLISFIALPLLDAPWLYFNYERTNALFKQIQGGRSLQFRMWAAIAVYAALAGILITQTSLYGAAFSGLATYAVYDFTNLLVFKDYSIAFACADTIWGGVLMSVAYLLIIR